MSHPQLKTHLYISIFKFTVNTGEKTPKRLYWSQLRSIMIFIPPITIISPTITTISPTTMMVTYNDDNITDENDNDDNNNVTIPPITTKKKPNNDNGNLQNTSPFDSSLLGLNDLQAEQIITLNKEPKRQASQDPAQMSPQTRSSSTRLFAKGDTHKGHIPKGVYVPNKNKKDKELVFYLHQVRLTGESLVCLDEKPTEDNVDVQQFVVEREVPYDFLREVSPVSQHPTATEYHLLTITYIYKVRV